MRSTILFILFTLFAFNQSGQTTSHDSILKNNADKYLINKFGNKFKEKYLRFLFIQDAGIYAAFYEVKSKTRADGKNTVLVYFRYESEEVDTLRFVFGREEIMNCSKGKGCSLFIGFDKAKEIAMKAGFPENEQPWTISAQNFGANQIPKWGISSNNSSAHRKGHWIEISMRDGSVESGFWSSSD